MTSLATSQLPAGRVGGATRRMKALATAELRLLIRNRMALFMTLAMPVGTALLFTGLDVAERAGVDLSAMVVTMVAGFAILFVVYYNLVATYAARREDLVLKRLRSGELTDTEILAGTAVPSVAVAVGQIVVVAVAAPLLFDLPMPVNPVLVVVGLVLGTVAWVPLAAVSSVFTRNAEMAQLTTLPALLVAMVFSGFVIPLEVMPEPMARIAEFVPLTPVLDLMRMGLVGETIDGTSVDFVSSFGAAVVPAAILVAWAMIGWWAVRRWFRWEPRR